MTDDPAPINPPDELKGIGTYRLVRAMCASPVLVPVFWGAAVVIEPLSNAAGRLLFGIFLLLAFATPFVAIAGLVWGAVAGSRGQLSDAIDRRMWRLMGVVIGRTVLLFWLA